MPILKGRTPRFPLAVTLIIIGAFLVSTAMLWSRRDDDRKESLAERISRLSSAHSLRFPRFTAVERPAGLSPFGDFEPSPTAPAGRTDLVATAIGWIDLRQPDHLLSRLPSDLRAPGRAVDTVAGKGRLGSGVNILQIDRGALDRLPYDSIRSEIVAAGGRILGAIPNRALIVRAINPEAARALGSLTFVEKTGIYEPAYKISPLVGRMPLIERARALSPILQLDVQIWPDADPAVARERLERIVGTENVIAASLDGRVYRVKTGRAGITRMAADELVAGLSESLEYMLSDAATPSILMIGTIADSFEGARPFHDLGIDGGGIDTNNDGRRLNDGSDDVPPQIVAATDNGLSLDAVHLSHTATQPSIPLTAPVGPRHRKVHALQAVADSALATCDSKLSGSSTHGNVIAGIIAGHPGELGFRYTLPGGPDSTRAPELATFSLDALARGSRILMQDAAPSTLCTINELVETGGNVSPGFLIDRLNQAICPKSGGTGTCQGIIGGGAELHLHVMPFGTPNFDNIVNNTTNGTYPLSSSSIDHFLVNNLDYMVFVPVGNQGNFVADGGNLALPRWPDLFNGTALDNDPNATPNPLQISPPATAKNIVSVGASFMDAGLEIGLGAEFPLGYSSHGPATAPSLRTAPLVTAVGDNFSGFGASYVAASIRSRDNDNTAPVENEIDPQNRGTSFSSGFATAAGALVRDYYAQGFYPTANRVAEDRMPRVSGSLVRAALVASANFGERFAIPARSQPGDLLVANSRAVHLGVVSGANVGVIGNGVQGYGRIVLDQVLPLSNYPPTRGAGVPTVEYPAAGLIVYDALGTGEAPIDNAAHTMTAKTFRVDGLNAVTLPSGTRVIANGQLRIALSWPDPPSPADSGGELINDLDLEVESPGPDNCLNAADTRPDGGACPAGSANDNLVYDGNVYILGDPLPAGQWSLARGPSDPAIHDTRNNIEAVHLSSLVDDTGAKPNQLAAGTWEVRVKRGSAGAVPGQIVMIDGANEDAVASGGNGNGRLDAGEDDDSDGLLDWGGQPFSLVIAGPVFGNGSQVWNSATHAFPDASARLDKYLYGCADSLIARILEIDGSVSGAAVTSNTRLLAVDSTGSIVDEETNFAFVEVGAGRIFEAGPIPVRLAVPAIRNNGILEADDGLTLLLQYADAPRSVEASARVLCTPNITAAAFEIQGRADLPNLVGRGCDGDQHLDAGESVTYTIVLESSELNGDLRDVVATLAPAGPGAGAIRVLDSPKNVGLVPGGEFTGVTFTLMVDGAAANALPLPDRRVDLVLTLDMGVRNVQLSRISHTFSHLINADDEALHYSTDFPGGGREVRDYNRNLQIDRPDTFDAFRQVFWPHEDISFSSMFVPGTASGRVTNTLGEDLNENGVLDAGEDVIPNGVLDPGILAQPTGPGPGDRVPWNFDTGDGGWVGFRHPISNPGTVAATSVWEYQTLGLCGFQSAIPDGNPAALFQSPGAAGIWHTGDGNPGTPTAQSNACESYPFPGDSNTPPLTEFYYDVLHSPIIAKVHQIPDARGLPYTVEFQRLGLNINIQIPRYAGGSLDLDSDVHSDVSNCLLCDYMYGLGGRPDERSLARFNIYYNEINPSSYVLQRTFGLLDDPDGSFAQNRFITGDETGFTAFTDNSNPSSSSPIPFGQPDFRPFPDPGAPQVCVEGCTNPAECCEQNTAAGPERNFDMVLLDYEDGIVYLSPNINGNTEPQGGFAPGPAGNFWQIGIGFWARETPSGARDYGIGIDDVVLEWDEVHPVDEGGGVPACSRFGGEGEPAGLPCATLSVDRLELYECNETLEVTVHDPRSAGLGVVTVLAASDSDSQPFQTGVTTARIPRKSFTLDEVPGTPGLFRGTVMVNSLFSDESLLFTNPATDGLLRFYYLDPLCDGDADGQAGENAFGDIDSDGIDAGDNCPFRYNPGQEDTDGDGIGDACDNCPGVPNSDQQDSDADLVGDLCDLDDIDFDGVVNAIDNCPDVYNPTQAPAPGAGNRGAACNAISDRDGDGVADRNDNCVRTPNPAQTNLDQDRLGDACDGDCVNARSELLDQGVCAQQPLTICSAGSPCPDLGVCAGDGQTVCSTDANCTPQPGGPCINLVPQSCVRIGVVNDGGCNTVNDDVDGDGVTDAVDNCPTVPNPPVVPGTTRQLDKDQDGVGDTCDPEETVDDDNDGIPDDAISFGTAVSCRTQPLANLVVLSTRFRDTNGDGDIFADTGETVRLSVVLRNAGPDLSDVRLILGSTDPDIACITKQTILLPDPLPNGATIDTADLGDPDGEFEFIVNSTTQTVNPGDPERGIFFLTVAAAELVGTATNVTIEALLDLDVVGGEEPSRVVGPDGLAGTADDGIVFEDFDTGRFDQNTLAPCDTIPDTALPDCTDLNPDGTARISVSGGAENVPNDTIGVTVGTAPGGINVLTGLPCGGFLPQDVNPQCIIDPDHDMDWHIHCPAGECDNGTGYVTASDGNMAFSGKNSLHWGYHFDTASRRGDSTHVRAMAAFMTSPINLTLFPQPGDLELSFYHIIMTMGNEWNGLLFENHATDYGDVHVQIDQDPDPAIDAWGVWDKLAPFQNVYDHIAYVWSSFNGGFAAYCTFTPPDAGTAPPAPRGFRELLCYPSGVWSHCGNSRDTSGVFSCEGPGVPGNTGTGLWVQTKFNLANFVGQRVRLRWIAQSWVFDASTNSYFEVGGTWSNIIHDDGWWVDDIQLTGAIQSQFSPVADVKTPPAEACPTDACDESVGDNGFVVDFQVSDSDGDGIFVAGETVTASAGRTTAPGRCVGGGTQFQFFRDGQVVQDWSSDPTFTDNPTRTATYLVRVRCSADTACTTGALATAANSQRILVYRGDADDLLLDVSYDPALVVTTLEWPSVFQPLATTGYDAYAGTIAAAGDPSLGTLSDAACLGSRLPQPPGAPGPLVSTTDATTTPGVGEAIYYLAGYAHETGSGLATLVGRRSDGTLRAELSICP